LWVSAGISSCCCSASTQGFTYGTATAFDNEESSLPCRDFQQEERGYYFIKAMNKSNTFSLPYARLLYLESINTTGANMERNLLHLLDCLEKAANKKSWVDIAFATSALRDILEELPHNNPYPWEKEKI